MFKFTTHMQSVQQSNNYKFFSADALQPSKFATGVTKIPKTGHLYNFSEGFDWIKIRNVIPEDNFITPFPEIINVVVCCTLRENTLCTNYKTYN